MGTIEHTQNEAQTDNHTVKIYINAKHGEIGRWVEAQIAQHGEAYG
jgi:hypothetical protein